MTIHQWSPFLLVMMAILNMPATIRGQDPSSSELASGQTVYVSVSRGQLHSGPAETFYPTGFVERGSTLEVFHRTQDGWLGVRPPAGSFSWVAASDAYLLPGGRVIEIISGNAVSWIGTDLGTAKQFRWQVQLNQGEQLTLLGEKTQADADGRETLWYQIAPPNGEFRWVLANAVSEQPVSAAKDRPSKTAKMQSPTPSQSSRPSSAARPANSKVVTAAAQQTVPHDDVFNPPVNAGESVYYDGEIVEGEMIEGQYVDGEYYDGDYYGDETIIGEYPAGEIIEGDIYAGQSVHGNYVDGPFVDGEVFEGEVIYEDGSPYPPEQIVSGSRDPFSGWHAMELGENGMRFTLFERLWGRKPVHDPLAHDPFDLTIPERGPPAPLMPTQTFVTRQAPVESVRRHRPWRDPRTLGSRRHDSYSSIGSLDADSSRDFSPSTRYAQNQETSTGGVLAAMLSGIGSKTPEEPSATGLSARLASSSQSIVSETKPVNWYGVLDQASTGTTEDITGQNSYGLNQLQVAISEIVSQPMSAWRLQPLYEQAQHFVQNGSTAIERGQARLMMERIEEFAALATKNGYTALNVSIPINTAQSTVSLAGAGRSDTSVVPSGFQSAATASGLSGYDATGWLVPVLAATPGQPTHALTDDSGQILAYVTALPGMNLDRYLNQAVGISGLRGYLPQLQAGHIQAQRVVRLQTQP